MPPLGPGPPHDYATPIASVVIPARNAAHQICGQLLALSKQDFRGEWEVIVSDNGSSDNTARVASSFTDRLPSLRVVDASRGPGINVARNEGSRAARGGIILYCDADDEVSPEWVSAMVAASRSADVLGGRVETARLNGTRALRRMGAHPLESGLSRVRGFLPYASGCNLALKVSVGDSIGWWDEDYQGGGDDIEICWRAQLAGYRLAFVPGAVVHYRYREDARSVARQAASYGRADAKLYKHYRSKGMPPRTCDDMLREVLGTVKALLEGLPGRRSGRGVYRAARLYGRAMGSLRERVFYV